MMAVIPSLLAAFILSVSLVTPVAQAQTVQFCRPGEAPSFRAGFAALKTLVGASMGTPTTCEHPNGVNGDTLQSTTTGLAFYRRSTNTPTFTDGFMHWAVTSSGLVTWTGSSVDPPLPSAPSEEPLQCALILYDPTVLAHSTTFESCSGSRGLQLDLHNVGQNFFANIFLDDGSLATVQFANVRRQIVQLPVDVPGLAGGVLLMERDADGTFNVSIRWP